MASPSPLLGTVLLITPSGKATQGVSALQPLCRELVVCKPSMVAQDTQQASVELVILDESLPTDEAMALLSQFGQGQGDLPVAVVTAKPSVEESVEFIKAGAYDYIPGPLDVERLGKLIAGMHAENDRRRGGRDRFFCEECPPDVQIVGRSPALTESLRMIRLVAESKCNPILILGETGTGKELAAKAVHSWRCGQSEKFVAVNCAALSATLLESELFGHVKGAFTGADSNKVGLFEAADDGTLFLDEISEMSVDLQAKLLRVLQERTFRKVGSTRDIPCKASIVASSNRDLLSAVEEGKFRRDLYYRLAVFPITLPPLRSPERISDIPLLAEFFAESLGEPEGQGVECISRSVIRRLESHSWPGNVRELRNVVERAAILAQGAAITTDHIVMDSDMSASARRQQSARATRPSDSSPSSDDLSLETAEREFINRALRETGWQRTRAAALLGITRATLHAKLKKYNINPPDTGKSQSRSGKSRELQKSVS